MRTEKPIARTVLHRSGQEFPDSAVPTRWESTSTEPETRRGHGSGHHHDIVMHSNCSGSLIKSIQWFFGSFKAKQPDHQARQEPSWASSWHLSSKLKAALLAKLGCHQNSPDTHTRDNDGHRMNSDSKSLTKAQRCPSEPSRKHGDSPQ